MNIILMDLGEYFCNRNGNKIRNVCPTLFYLLAIKIYFDLIHHLKSQIRWSHLNVISLTGYRRRL